MGCIMAQRRTGSTASRKKDCDRRCLWTSGRRRNTLDYFGLQPEIPVNFNDR
jgi:hypothetical protein